MPSVKINDIKIYYEIRGEGQPLLLIAGLNADNASWFGVRGMLARRFRVITCDNRGSGRSSVPKGSYSIRQMADDTAGLLEHLKIKKCHVIGHSLGGYIAQELAISYPERVAKLVLEATAPISSTRNNVLFNDFLECFEKDRDKERLISSWSYWLFSPKTFERKGWVEIFLRNALRYPYFQTARGFRGQAEAMALFDARKRIKKIKAKTFIIMGRDDILIYPFESMALADGIKKSVFEQIGDAGHCVHVERPDLFVSRVIRFLES